MNYSSWSKFLHGARVAGLETVILATTGRNSPTTQERLAQLRFEEGVNAIVLDRDDLIEVTQPEDLLLLIKEKIRELLYQDGF